MSEQNIDGLQQWMHTLITAKGNLHEQLALAQEKHEWREEEVVVSGRIPVRTRLNIYSSGYLLRLLECMRADFPALHTFMGEQVFMLFARAYLLSYPSKSYTLFDLSADFPDFLAATRPPSRPGMDDSLLDLPAELARFERTRTEAARLPGTENHPSSAIELFSFLGESFRLQLPECTRLLEMKFPLLDFYRRLEKGERPDPPVAKAAYVLIGRKNYRLTIAEITEIQYIFLGVCKNAVSFNQAVIHAAEQCNQPADAVADMYLWLPVAIDNGWLIKIPD